MYTLLVLVIFLTFISLGLPDSLLGSGWPKMYETLNVPLSYAGIISMIISACTIISSLMADKLNMKFGTKKITSASILISSLALFLFSISKDFYVLCLVAIPYGLSAGCIDASINNYAVLHMKANIVSWLHCMWGLGASVSPIIMSFALNKYASWQMGYRIVAILQFIIALIVFFSTKVWRQNGNNSEEEKQESISLIEVIKLPGAKYMLVAFLCYCGFESICFIWTSTYFVNSFELSEKTAAILGSLFYAGMMSGRFVNGFIADKFKDKTLMLFGGSVIISLSLISLLNNFYLSVICFFLMGVMAGPIYPSIIHETPTNYGKKVTQSIIGVQMAFAYIGTTLTPYVFGLIAQYVDIKLLPVFICFIMTVFVLLMEIFHKKVLKYNSNIKE